jgi:hypothetical protein
MNSLKSPVSALAAPFVPYALHIATPSQVVEVSDVDEQIKFIREEFEPFFEKYHAMLAVVQNRFEALEASNGWSMPVQRLASELETLESMVPKSLKLMKEQFSLALERLPDNVVNDVFIKVCDDPNVFLESDMLY